MNCKYCGAQLDEGTTLCPFCQKENSEQPEPAEEVIPAEDQLPEAEADALKAESADSEPELAASDAEEVTAEEAACEELREEEELLSEEADKDALPEQKAKPKAWKIVLAVISGVVLLGVLVCAVLYGLGYDFKPRENNILYKDSYTIKPEKAEKVSAEQVAVIADQVLDNAQLQIYYNMTINDFVNYYGYYLTSLGLDTTQPFDTQQCTISDGMTWQQYFLDNSLGIWHRYTVLSLLAQEEGYTLDETLQQELDKLPEQIQTWAEQYGFESAEAMLQADFGPICSMEAYTDYMQTYYLAMQYQEEKYALLEPTAEEVEIYFAENEDRFAESGITRDGGAYYDVRHILITPEGGTTDESGQTTTYSDDEWAACLAKAEEVLDEWKAGEATENSFADLAAKYSTDGGSSSNGGLYSQLTSETNFVEEFKQWYLDESRQPGDTGIVKSVYGYHIMFFSGSEEIWAYNAKTTLLSEKWNTLIEDGMAKWPMEVSYKKIALCDRVEEETAETTEATEAETVTEATAAEESSAAATE